MPTTRIRVESTSYTGTMVLMGTIASAAGILGTHPSSWLLALSGLFGGFAVGVAGMGGGALMTPALVLLFGIDPRVAIASDLVNSLAMKPVGGAVHALHGSVNWALVRLLVVPGVPAAFFGAWLLNQVGNTSTDQHRLKTLLGWALVVACASLVARASLSARLRRRGQAAANPAPWRMKPLPTVFAGLLGGVMVGMTSVGAGSLVIVLLMLIYPRLSSKVQVGTNLVQAVPLVAAAALGQALFGHADLTVAGSLILGSVPGAFLGARVSSRAPEAIVRPALVALLTASGLALLITSYTGLAWAIAITAVIGLPLWGAVDATSFTSEQWQEAGLHRTTWVTLMGVGAPLGVGLVVAAVYAVRLRPRVLQASAASLVAAAGKVVEALQVP
ncbi:MAG: sulfite exporter TauE/SafE family protein [Actinomycetota bacterium]|jgi:uncharacterized membrane protein YfcA|nr:sulfite exporter TauE/SafE family protein [Actinomycetota bacterium]